MCHHATATTSITARLAARAATAACALLLAACSSINPFSSDNAEAEQAEPLTEFEPSVTVTTVWSRNVGSSAGKRYLRLRPAVIGDRVVAADADGQVSAYDVASGETLWENDTDTPVSGGPGVGDDLAVVGTIDGEVLAIKADSGELAWRQRVSSEVLAAPAVADGVVVVRTQDGKLVGLAATDGTRLWAYDRAVPALSLRGTGSPVTTAGAVVAGLDNGLLVALALKDGTLLWESRIAAARGRSELERLVDIDADPVIADGIIYTVTYQGRVAAVERASGRVQWRRDMSSHVGLGVASDSLFITDDQSLVWAIDRDNGASVWRQDKLTRRALTPPAVFGSHVAIGDYEGYVHLLDQDDGRLAGRVRVGGDALVTAPVVVGELLLVYGRGGTLTALRVE